LRLEAHGDYSGYRPRDPHTVIFKYKEYIQRFTLDTFFMPQNLLERAQRNPTQGDYSGSRPRDPHTVNFKYKEYIQRFTLDAFFMPQNLLERARQILGHKKTPTCRSGCILCSP
jgi:hypothetical protein